MSSQTVEEVLSTTIFWKQAFPPVQNLATTSRQMTISRSYIRQPPKHRLLLLLGVKKPSHQWDFFLFLLPQLLFICQKYLFVRWAELHVNQFMPGTFCSPNIKIRAVTKIGGRSFPGVCPPASHGPLLSQSATSTQRHTGWTHGVFIFFRVSQIWETQCGWVKVRGSQTQTPQSSMEFQIFLSVRWTELHVQVRGSQTF